MNILEWIEDYRKQIKHEINRIEFAEMDEWKFRKGIIQRDDKSFFSIKAVTSNHPEMEDTVIVHQPEIGILGFILCIQNDELYILLHAKSEPGNVNLTQIGPSVQATESNYNKKHAGRPTPFIEKFTEKGHHLIFSINQSEQGNRFYNKYNRNVAVLVDNMDLEFHDKKFKWFKHTEVIKHLNEPHLFNTDFKSVISHLFEYLWTNEQFFGHVLQNKIFDSCKKDNINSVERLITRINKKRNANKFTSQLIELNELPEWDNESNKFNAHKAHFNFDYFSITLFDRERIHWNQPLITKESTEKLILIVGMYKDKLCLVFRERYEIGYANYFQLGPTYQFDEFSDKLPEDEGRLIFSFNQSEEGGRFYKNKSIYAVYERDNIDEFLNSDEYYILNFHEVLQMLKVSGILTNESRTLIASFMPSAFISDKSKPLD